MMDTLYKRAILKFIAFGCGATWSASGHCTTVEDAAQNELASLVGREFATAASQFHYAASISEQSRIEDRRGLVPMLRAVFMDIEGLSQARRARDLDTRAVPGFFVVVSIFAGDGSNWLKESTRFVPAEVSYRFSRKGDGSFVIVFRYVNVNNRLELLDIQLKAPSNDVNAVAQLEELRSRAAATLLGTAARP
jgi:hypothetical protein